MTIVFVTGMSGTGKSTALAELARRGFEVLDTDYDGWSEEVPLGGGGFEQLWREDRIETLLAGHRSRPLFVSGTVANQVKFYPRFDAIVLLTVPLEVALARIDVRTTNDFGKAPGERQRIIDDHYRVEPLLRRGATDVIDSTQPPRDVADALAAIAANGSG